jgi:hypothetical protein
MVDVWLQFDFPRCRTDFQRPIAVWFVSSILFDVYCISPISHSMLPAFLFSLTSLDDATSMHDYVVVNDGDMQEFILPEEPVDVKVRYS